MSVRERDATRTGQVMQLILDRIQQRTLTSGARLPSVRAMAEATGFSKSTVVEAYDRLAADGAIRSRPVRDSTSRHRLPRSRWIAWVHRSNARSIPCGCCASR